MNIQEYLGNWPQRTLVTVKTQKQGFMFSPCKTYKYYSDAKSFFLFHFIFIINLYDKTPTVYNIYAYIYSSIPRILLCRNGEMIERKFNNPSKCEISDDYTLCGQ